MLQSFEEGPHELVQAEMEKLGREALLVLVRSFCRWMSYCGLPNYPTLEDIRAAKKSGKFVGLSKRSDRFLADPDGETRKWVRRSKAAKTAARRRKREQKLAARLNAAKETR